MSDFGFKAEFCPPSDSRPVSDDRARGHPDRRRWLKAAAAASSTLWLPRWAWSQPKLSDNPFTLGVASGSPSADGVVLWTRLARYGLFQRSLMPDEPVTVRWELAEDEAFRRRVRQGQVQALPELAHSVHIELEGLEPGRSYHYRFAVGGSGNDWVSPVGRTRTLPAADAEVGRLRLAYASCQRWEHGHYAAWRHLVADAPDVVVFLGDYIYEYPSAMEAVRSHGEGWVISLADYRRRYALHRSDAALRDAHAACPWFVIWDDHEVQNDYAGEHPGDAGPTVADFAARRAAAYQAFYEHMPLRRSVLSRVAPGAGGPLRLYGQARLGRLGSLSLLDTRQFRSRQACTRNGAFGSSTVDPSRCPSWLDPARTLLGAEQERWFAQAATAAGREGWHVVAQTTLFGQRDYRSGAGQSFWNDGWDGYAPARRRFIDALQGHGKPNAVLLGGDVHENWVGHVKADYNDPASATVGIELCGTAITSRSGGNEKLPERLARNPHFVFADSQGKGYGLLDLRPQSMSVQLRVVDDVTRADSGIGTLARFEVAAGSARLERA